MVRVEIHIDIVDPGRGVVHSGGERAPAQPHRVGSVVVTDVPGEVDVVTATLRPVWNTLIGPDHSRYSPLIGGALLCWCQYQF